MQVRRDRNPANRCDFLPSSFASELYRQYNRFSRTVDKSAFDFSAMSSVPFITRPKWLCEVDVVYIPIQIERQHWLGLVIDVTTWRIIVLDCNRSCLSDQQIQTYLEHISVMIPYLLRKHGVNSAAYSLRLDPLKLYHLG